MGGLLHSTVRGLQEFLFVGVQDFVRDQVHLQPAEPLVRDRISGLDQCLEVPVSYTHLTLPTIYSV